MRHWNFSNFLFRVFARGIFDSNTFFFLQGIRRPYSSACFLNRPRSRSESIPFRPAESECFGKSAQPKIFQNIFKPERSFSGRIGLKTEIGPAEWTGQRAATFYDTQARLLAYSSTCVASAVEQSSSCVYIPGPTPLSPNSPPLRGSFVARCRIHLPFQAFYFRPYLFRGTFTLKVFRYLYTSLYARQPS